MDQEQIERNIAFIIEQQAKFWADIEVLKQARKEPDPHVERRLNRLERLFLLGVGAGRRERRARHDWDAKINALINAQMQREEIDRQAKQAFEVKMAALDAKLAVLAESHAITEEVIQQTRRQTEEVIQQTRRQNEAVFQQTRRQTEEVFQQSRRETEEMFQQSRRETAEAMQQAQRETEKLLQQLRREAEVANLESQRRFDQRMDALAAANTQLTVAMAELARALASTSTRVDVLSAR